MTIDKAIELLRPYVGRAAIAAAILAFGLAAAWLVRRLARREMTRHKSDPIAAHFVSQLAYAIVAILATAAALGQLGVQTASIVAVVGAAGIAVGLALQNSLSNLASGILLVTLKPFHAGDYIEGAGQAGSVIEVGFFTTTLRTFDGRKVVIPNSKLTDDSIVNYSTHPTRRIDAKVSVGYATDLPKARAVARDVLANDGRVLADPAPVVSVDELADSGITLGVRAWVKREDYWPVRFELLEKIKIAFDAAGIEIPFPQRVVRLLQDDTRNRGFSLVELTVVLFILALVAHLGVSNIASARAGDMARKAARQLDLVADAVYDGDSDPPGGFLCDMGRLPFAAALPGAPHGAAITNALSELYARPAGLGALEARPASAANLAPGAPPEIADDEVLVPCGWGGPYLRLPAGDDRLRDPWGNPFENPDAAGLSRLLDAAGNPATATNTCVAAIRHFGADAMDDAARPPASATQRDGSRAFETGTGALLLTFEPGSVSKFRWYQPAGDKITGASTNVAPAASQAVADGISPGIRFAKVFFSNGSSRVIQFKIQPGRVTPIAL